MYSTNTHSAGYEVKAQISVKTSSRVQRVAIGFTWLVLNVLGGRRWGLALIKVSTTTAFQILEYCSPMANVGTILFDHILQDFVLSLTVVHRGVVVFPPHTHLLHLAECSFAEYTFTPTANRRPHHIRTCTPGVLTCRHIFALQYLQKWDNSMECYSVHVGFTIR